MRPSSTLASVTVGRVLPRPQAGPGLLPADSGPTCSRPPASTLAIEPPPAPMVSICIIGARTTMPNSIAVCAASETSPPATSDTSKDVPPMSP